MESGLEPIVISTALLLQMARYLDSVGLDAAALLAAKGHDPAVLKDPDARIPLALYLDAEAAAVEATGDPCFGLHMGEHAEPGSWNILGYMMMNCTTLAEAFAKSGRYHKIIGTLIRGKPGLGKSGFKIVLKVPPHAPAMPRHCFEATLASMVVIARKLAGRPDIAPNEVRFSAPAPSAQAFFEEYRRVFRCPVRFAQGEDSIAFEPSLGAVPVLAPNPGLLRLFEEHADEFLARIEGGRTTTRKVSEIILSRLDDRKLGIKAVARELSMSVRSLQARLLAEGSPFSALLQDTREALAKKHLREGYTVEDITFMLGFSDPSAFRKAFKKWTGLTPKEFRDAKSA